MLTDVFSPLVERTDREIRKCPDLLSIGEIRIKISLTLESELIGEQKVKTTL